MVSSQQFTGAHSGSDSWTKGWVSIQDLPKDVGHVCKDSNLSPAKTHIVDIHVYINYLYDICICLHGTEYTQINNIYIA